MEITWTKIIVFAGTSGILSALIGHGLTLFSDWRKKNQQASYLAIRLATGLETFADDCMSVIGEFDMHKQSDGAAGKRTTKLPILSDFPSDEDGWRSFPTDLTAKALSFPNHVKAGQDRVSFTRSVADEFATWEDCEEQCARLGLQAWLLASELRRRFSFPPFEPRYDLAGALRGEVARWNTKT